MYMSWPTRDEKPYKVPKFPTRWQLGQMHLNPLWFGMPFVSYASQTQPNSMQRLLASLILCIVAWGPLSPLATATAGDPIPACCRRDGKHHCTMSGSTRTEMGATGVYWSKTQSRCPMCPRMIRTNPRTQAGLSASAAVFAAIISHPAVFSQTQSEYRVSAARSHQKRGPPTDLA